MYYVYYIKGIKIGCTKNLKKRVEQEQGYKDYTILFKSKDIKKASNAEIMGDTILVPTRVRKPFR